MVKKKKQDVKEKTNDKKKERRYVEWLQDTQTLTV